jgi:hypothetical protein
VGVGLVIALASGSLAGCVSTQQKNERAKIRATRELESRKPQRVTRSNPQVRVEGISLVRGRDAGAIVVDLRSSADAPLTDVPISVGLRTHGGRELLNGRKNLGWFQTHVPSIAAGGRATWVFTTRRAVPAGRPYARVGVPASPPITEATSLPEITAERAPALAAATVTAPRARRGERARARARPRLPLVRVEVDNRCSIPQTDLQVYAIVRARGRAIAAGKTTLKLLDGGKQTVARLGLVGAAGSHTIRVEAIPTIFE